MNNLSETSIDKGLDQALLETMVKHIVKDLNELIDFKNNGPDSSAIEQRKLLFRILLENNFEVTVQADFVSRFFN